MALILAGDVGATKTVLALFEPTAGALAMVADTSLPSQELPSLEAAVEQFLGDRPARSIAAACVGVAGPVVDGRVVTTNLPWMVDERRLAERFAIPRVRLLNDLEATGHGVLALPAKDLAAIQVGTPRDGNRALIAAGTGLGEALLVRVPGTGGWSVMPSEGGHVDFAPRTDLEVDLLRFLCREGGHVSYERVLSGPGLVNIYRFARHAGLAMESTSIARGMATEDPSAVISAHGVAGDDALCVAALDIFVRIYGAEAGNLALKALAVGGVVVAGGIAPKILSRLMAGDFASAFRDKGRLAPLLETISVHVALDPRAPLYGAARVAAGLLPPS